MCTPWLARQSSSSASDIQTKSWSINQQILFHPGKDRFILLLQAKGIGDNVSVNTERRRKLLVLYTADHSTPGPQCSSEPSPHEKVVQCLVDLMSSQFNLEVSTPDKCREEILHLKPRKWLHRQLDHSDVVVIVNSKEAVQRLRCAYFDDSCGQFRANARMVNNVFDIAMEGIMARLQSAQIADSPSRYVVVTFAHFAGVENLIPYLSTEINYRLMDDWLDFCRHVHGSDDTQLYVDSVSTSLGAKLNRALESAYIFYNSYSTGDTYMTSYEHCNMDASGPNDTLLSSNVDDECPVESETNYQITRQCKNEPSPCRTPCNLYEGVCQFIPPEMLSSTDTLCSLQSNTSHNT